MKKQPRKRAVRRAAMNKLQREYAGIAEQLRQDGAILECRFESVKLLLANGEWHCPHFYVRHPNGDVEFVDIPSKAFVNAFLARLKSAAGAFPTFVFTLAQKTGGEWTAERIGE